MRLELELYKDIELEEGQELEDVIFDKGGLATIRDEGVQGWELDNDNYEVVEEIQTV